MCLYHVNLLLESVTSGVRLLTVHMKSLQTICCSHKNTKYVTILLYRFHHWMLIYTVTTVTAQIRAIVEGSMCFIHVQLKKSLKSVYFPPTYYLR